MILSGFMLYFILMILVRRINIIKLTFELLWEVRTVQ